ncbi:hypothetical protein [Pontibacter sp. H249]|uniref:hypothetical protein n=1 Tax=Pontibacter sp. H249 TaxID=3133420 RepID=UPI0030BA5F4F
MNRNFDNENRQRKNHYADFDDYGNPRTGNRNSLSRHTPESKYGSFGQRNQTDSYDQQRQYDRRATNATRAYGDMSQGTRYGEGGSNEGGGSSYGHSYYGLSGDHGPSITQHDRNRQDSKQYDGHGDYDHFMNRNYGNSFGSSSDGGYTSRNRENEDRRENQNRDSRLENRSGNRGYEENRGYDRGYDSFGNTGYGATGYNMRDLDRERGAYGNQQRFRDDSRGYRSEPAWDRDNSQNQSRSRFNRDMDW